MIFLIPFQIILAVLLIFWHFRLYRERQSFKRWVEADRIHVEMYHKYCELVDDCTMTQAKWKEWLPIFEHADQIYESSNYLGIKFDRLADYVRREISDKGLTR